MVAVYVHGHHSILTTAWLPPFYNEPGVERRAQPGAVLLGLHQGPRGRRRLRLLQVSRCLMNAWMRLGRSTHLLTQICWNHTRWADDAPAQGKDEDVEFMRFTCGAPATGTDEAGGVGEVS